MTPFRDYSTYLQRIVRLERVICDLCNQKMYLQARRRTMELQQVVLDLSTLLEDLTNEE
jgi:hypothetical protein